MAASAELVLFWLAAGAQAAGLLTLAAARISERSAAAGLCRRLFFFGMATVGGAALAAAACGSGCWVWCGATLSLMAVGATLDGGRGARPAAI